MCHALSNLEKRLRNFDRARSVLEEVVRVKPTAALCVSLAELERIQGLPEQARATLRYGLKRCRNDKSDRTKLLVALAWIEEDIFHAYDEATHLIEEAISIDPMNIRTFTAKANMEIRRHRMNDARQTLLTACKLPSDDGQHYTMLGSLELDCGHIEEARKVLQEGATKYPGDQFLLQRWGALEAKYGTASKARELFKKSVQIKPHAPTFVAWAILEDEEGIKVQYILFL